MELAEMIKEKVENAELPLSLKEELVEKLVKENITDEKIIDEIIEETVKAYKRTLVEPGEAVGVVAAQSIGEPGTQMSLPYEERIIIKEGEFIKGIEIGKLVDEMIENYGFEKIGNSEVCDLPIDIYVPSLDQDEKIRWKRIISCIRHKHNGKLIKLKTKSGRKITATPYHSFVIRKDNKIVPVKGSELNVGDRIPVVKHIPANCVEAINISDYVSGNYVIDELNNKITPKINGKSIPNNIKLDYDFGYFIGMYLAEGSLTKYFVSISNVDENVLNKIKVFADRFNLNYGEYDNNSGFAESHDIRIYSSTLVEFLSNFGTSSKTKKISDFVFGANKEFVRGLLRGYFDGDGNVNAERRVIRISSNSKELIDGIAILLARFNIFSIKTKIKEQFGLIIPHRYAKIFYEEINFTVEKKRNALEKLVNALDDEKTYDSIDMIPSIGDALTKLGEKVNYPKEILKKFEKTQKIGRGTLKRHLNKMKELAIEKGVNLEKMEEYYLLNKAVEGDVVWDEIVEIEEIVYGKEYVYDISVEGLETFTTFDGILTHNTMRTFHYAGVAELNVTLGLPRMIEIVDARKEPSTPMMTIYLEEGYRYDREKAEKVAKEIESTTIDTVSKSVSIDLIRECITIELDENRLRSRDLTIDDVVEAIKKKLKLKIDVEGNRLYLKIKNPSLKNLRKRLPKVRAVQLKGVPNIERVIIKKEGDEYVLYSEGSNLKEVFKIEGVDITRTTTNNIIEIQEVLGIEAARNAIINEMKSTLDDQGLDVDIRHLMLVADIMTADGEVKPIGRHGVGGEKASVLARAAFEETVKHLYTAAIRGYKDELKGVIENVIVGKPIYLGTGCVKLYIDRDYEEGKSINTTNLNNKVAEDEDN
ncbi:DNA-directed RNA polymerase subunit A'' [Methanotorris formicicus]|uniref:DNA-directed RNA polymerase subunit Rpo1C n=1 Tax=Methanotorris formicicus Mc-S-70 TaxID=647171 RepID=H1KXS2_9EURY|nr:DNA-directed RNA polymerase subunit A'' [Methanotorris formicicus]EHP87914.1 DNA-directed RNA polymerase, subunit A'' [Methanotorris formicicus Mc-S-70]